MSTVVKSTLFRPVTIGLRTDKKADYKTRVALGSRLDWEPMAGRLDWAAIEDCDEFHVRVRYAEYVETRKKSEHKAYNGRKDYRRVPDGRGFCRTICKVRHGRGDHVVRIRYADGRIAEQIIPAEQVIPTVRLFVSAQYIRRGLDMKIWARITKDTVRMIVRPVGI